MGREDRTVIRNIKALRASPGANEIEISLFGSGYGECVVVHLGNNEWVIVDSCLTPEREPVALEYLRALGLDPDKEVCLIVATHWHDDHIGGMSRLVESCSNATFCCSATFLENEFFDMLAALETRPATQSGSGVRELYRVFSSLDERSSVPKHALSGRLILNRSNCKIWALSPSDITYKAFLRRIGQLIPQHGEPKKRLPSLTPNEASVVLLMEVDKAIMLLGADLERDGWVDILSIHPQPNGKASVFKVPHHGSQDAHEAQVWNDLLEQQPFAILTPWRRGGRELPTKGDAQRILSLTSQAYVSASRNALGRKSKLRRSKPVERTLREIGVRLRPAGTAESIIRLRKSISSPASWSVETFGSACSIVKYA